MQNKPPFQDSIANAISERKKKNPTYSLRSFAQSIGETADHLSLIMNREKFPTPELIEKIGVAIEAGVQTIQVWQKEIREQKKAFFFHGHTDRDECDTNKWYHDAIIELIGTTGFESNYAFVAQELGIELQQATAAIDALERKEIVSTKTTPWTVCDSARKLVAADRSNLEKRQVQKDLLEIAIGAIDNVDLEKRVSRASTLAIHSDRLPEAKELILKFKRELEQFLSAGGPGDKVYHLAIGLFPNLSKDEEE